MAQSEEDKDDLELGVRVSLHLIGEAFEKAGYRFWCNELSNRFGTVEGAYDCAARKGQFTPRSFQISYEADKVNGGRIIIRRCVGKSNKLLRGVGFLLADPDLPRKAVDLIIAKANINTDDDLDELLASLK